MQKETAKSVTLSSEACWECLLESSRPSNVEMSFVSDLQVSENDITRVQYEGTRLANLAFVPYLAYSIGVHDFILLHRAGSRWHTPVTGPFLGWPFLASHYPPVTLRATCIRIFSHSLLWQVVSHAHLAKWSRSRWFAKGHMSLWEVWRLDERWHKSDIIGHVSCWCVL